MNRRRQLMLATVAAALMPPTSRAQPGRAASHIGWISFADPGIRLDEFREGLRGLGYGGARELPIGHRLCPRDAQAVLAVVDELIKTRVALIVAHISAAPFVHRAVAGRVPVVFAFSGDPVEAGLVHSLARPGGNTTGMSFMALELAGKRLELIKEMAPKMARVAILANPQHPGERAERRVSLAAAERLGVEAAYVELDPTQPFDLTLDNVRRQGCEGLVVFPDAGMLGRAPQIAAFALRERMLCVSGWSDFARAGCIASFGPNLREGYLRLAHYVDRILHGAAASSLPVELPTRLEMIINLKTAQALGLRLSKTLLLRADEVIQ